MGNDHTPLAQIELKTWANQVADIIKEQEMAVILVGHSRSGLIISEVAQRVPEKIKLLVYLAAFLIPSGESLTTTTRDLKTEVFFVPNSDGTLTIKPDKIVPILYNTTPSEWVQRVPSMLTLEPVATLITPLQLTDDRFGVVPRAYIECTEDNALAPSLQRSMRNQLPCKYVVTMNTDHSPFFSAPVELANNLMDLAGRE